MIRSITRGGPRPAPTVADNRTFELVVAESDVASLEREVAAGGGNVLGKEPFEPGEEADLYGDQQFEPMTVVAIAAGVAFVIGRISDVWLDHTRPGGQIIDLRTVPAQILPAPQLNRGELLVIRTDGRESFHARNKDEAASLLRSILGAGNA